MKNLRKSMSVILILLVSLFCFSTVAFASTSEQDGLKVELTTDKENYSLNEDIKINVTVTNTNDVTVENVKIDTLLPEEFTLKDKNKSTSSEAVDIPAGEKIQFSVVAVVKDGKSDKTSSDTDSKLTGASTNNKGNINKQNDKSPYTGKDYAVMTGFSALFIIGIVLLILCLKRNRKKTSKAVSSALCLVLAVTSIIGLADFKAKAENKQSDTNSSVVETNTDTASVISISENISVDGKDFTITANINYVNALTQKWFKDIEENHIAKSNTGIEYIDNRIIVLFSSETTEEQKKNVIDRVNGKLIGNDNGSKYQIQIKTTENLEELKSICLEVSKMNGVLWCFYETVDKIAKGNELLQSVPNDPWKDTFQGIWGTDWNEEKPSGLNWWLETIQAPSAWDYSNRFNSVKIGVVDNGFDTNHEDLNINLINPNENSSDLHGTHVAGIIGATANNKIGITGIVWNKELYCADVIATNKQNKNYVSILNKYDGIEATLEKGCKVVNLSMGAGEPIENNNDVLNCGATAAAYLLYWEQTIKRDFIIVQSAGNNGADSTKNGNFASITDDSINYLFNNQESIWSESDVSLKEKYTKNDIYKYFIVVGAIEKDGNNYKLCDHSKNIVKELRWASCYGDYVSVVAPGKDIFSTINSGGINGNYGYLDGTSMAAPIVSGVTALVWSINPNFTANEVKHIVCNSYNKTANGYQQSDNRAYPIVNAKLAVEEAIRRTDNKGVATGAFIDSITKKHIKNVTMNCIKYTGTLNNYKLSDFNIKTIDGIFYKDLHEGTYEYKIKSDNYTLDETVIIVVKKGKTTDKGTIELIKIKNGITGYVYDNDDFINNAKNTPISDVIIEVYKDNNLIGKTTTDKNGKYSISIDKNGSYDLLFKKSGYNDEKKTLTDVNGGFAKVNAYLQSKKTIVNGTLIEYNGHYYQVFDKGLNWNDAKAYCESVGGHLVTITSENEQQFVKSILSKTQTYNWLGGYKNNGKWEWITSEEWDYTNWGIGEPNNYLNRGENCLLMIDNGTWNDQLSTGDPTGIGLEDISFICEWESKDDIHYNGTPITKMKTIDYGQYTGNLGDSCMFNLDRKGLPGRDNRYYGNGNIGIDGTVYENGLEGWVARWNFKPEISWAYITYDIGGLYKQFSGNTNLIKSYSSSFNTTLYIYGDDKLLYSQVLTNERYDYSFNINVSNIKNLKIMLKDNVAVKSGTSFAIYDMFLN